MTTPTPAGPPRRYRRQDRARRDPIRDAAVRLGHAANDVLHHLDRTTSPRRSPTTATLPELIAAARAQLDRLDRVAASTDEPEQQP